MTLKPGENNDEAAHAATDASNNGIATAVPTGAADANGLLDCPADDLPEATVLPVVTDAVADATGLAELVQAEEAEEAKSGGNGASGTSSAGNHPADYTKRRRICLGVALAVCLGLGIGLTVFFMATDAGREIRMRRSYPACPALYFAEWLGDGHCDGGEFNTAACGYDGGDCTRANEVVRQSYPNCDIEGLYPESVGDGYSCEGFGVHNTEECGYDGGDCIEFNEQYPGCQYDYPSWIGDGQCDEYESNTELCGWDGGDCDKVNKMLWNTYPDCKGGIAIGSLGDGYCDGGAYNTAGCGWDGGDCIEANEFLSETYPNCTNVNPTSVGDGRCDGEGYNTPECGYDGGDCLEFDERYPDCQVSFPSWVGDGICDGVEYNKLECGNDGGDCL
mmetsp:Transcript_5606/g.15750  ORF Transcript_5606/g.15750 Transcript_5606/m.15750 type:complete len:391 (+) Transcript_5606:60-1232(+)